MFTRRLSLFILLPIAAQKEIRRIIDVACEPDRNFCDLHISRSKQISMGRLRRARLPTDGPHGSTVRIERLSVVFL